MHIEFTDKITILLSRPITGEHHKTGPISCQSEIGGNAYNARESLLLILLLFFLIIQHLTLKSYVLFATSGNA